MNNYLKCAVGLVLVTLVASGCGEEMNAPEPVGSADIEGYREWPLHRQAVTSTAGHGVSHVYGNDIVTNYLAKVAPAGVSSPAVMRYPIGSIIVKDVFLSGGRLKYVAVMRKPEVVPQGADAFGGWVWSQRKTSTGPDKFRDERDCLACHNQANSDTFKDYVFVFPVCEGRVNCME